MGSTFGNPQVSYINLTEPSIEALLEPLKEP